MGKAEAASMRLFAWPSAAVRVASIATLLLAVGLQVGVLAAAQVDGSSGRYEFVPEPDGYRMENYDAPVPESLRGATRVDALEVRRLQTERHALVVDVIPEHRRPDSLPEDQIWIPVKHRGVPGALWLPDVGFGPLSAVTEDYFRHHLQTATDGQLEHPVIFYCRIDCWMSWNAAKRALNWGYTDVYWFADGIDDWAFEGFDFEILSPAPGERQARP